MTNTNDNNVTTDADADAEAREFLGMLTAHVEEMRQMAIKEMAELSEKAGVRFMAVVETWQDILKEEPNVSEVEAFALITGTLAERIGDAAYNDRVMSVLATTVIGAKLYVDATKGTEQGVTQA